MTATLLVELFTEELPPKALNRLGQAFADGIANALKTRNFAAPDAQVKMYATPRRLAVSIASVQSVSPDRTVREKLLPASIGLDSTGQATAPLIKKLAALAAQAGLSPADTIDPATLERSGEGKAETLYFSYVAPGVSLATALQESLEQVLSALPIPKMMSYQRLTGPAAGTTVHFVRPAHGLVALHGSAIVPVRVLGLDAGRQTHGHRFLGQQVFDLEQADGYAQALQDKGSVIASHAQRTKLIRASLLKAVGDDQVLMPDSLLDEVSGLVEWPVVYTCHFEETFLEVPQECLILTMQTNQKYFALTDSQGRLRPRFLIVSNLATDTPEAIIEGNQRVVRPRLADAKFFFEQDQKKTLASRIPSLANVVYHNKLGNQLERMQRVQKLAVIIATELQRTGATVGIHAAERAAELAKTDLLTDMVGEFPELQGIMGGYYARHDDELPEVCAAMSEHYQPRFAGDQLPATMTGTILALADKTETLVGIWGIGLQPTGEKDPFALRRHALGILRMLLEKKLPLAVSWLMTQATGLFAAPAASAGGSSGFSAPGKPLTDFLTERLKGLLRDRGYDGAEIDAVLSLDADRLDDLSEKLDAIHQFASLPEAQSLAAANKRISNILRKNQVDWTLPSSINTALLTEPAEQALNAALDTARPDIEQAFREADYTSTLLLLAQLRTQIDQFFADVMVMADDAAIRQNRLALLVTLHQMLNRVADISRLAA